jgi:predicted DNA-binding transcriptional regulator AlpA
MSEWLTNTDIAEITGLKLETLHSYLSRNTLPKPDKYMGRTPVWKSETIKEWALNRETEITNE